MRYHMLSSLQAMADSKECRRTIILSYFDKRPEITYRCGCCDICSPKLDFLNQRIAPQIGASEAEKEQELKELFRQFV